MKAPAIVLYNPRVAEKKPRMPLSVMALGAVLEGRYPYYIVDGNLDPNAYDTLVALVEADPAVRYVGVTVMPGPQLIRAISECQRLKARFPHLKIIWGGYFPSIYTDVVLRAEFVDFVVEGQGELTLLDLLNASDNGGINGSIEGLSYRQDGGVHRGPQRGITDPNLFPHFPYERVQVERYLAKTFLGQRTLSHHTSMGCPYRCNFCGVTSMYKTRWKAQTSERVLQTIAMLQQRYGIDAIEFHDNDFFVSEKRVAEIARGLVGRRLAWWGEGRIDELLRYSDETWQLMKASGLKMIFTGAESGADEMLIKMDKAGVTTSKTLAFVERSRRHGIVPELSFVLGNPYDPERDIDEGIAFVRRLKEVNPDCEIILYLYSPEPIPGMFDDAVAQGFRYPERLEDWLQDPWRHFHQRRNPGTPWLTPRLVRKLDDFETVLNAYYPTLSDVQLSPSRRHLLRRLGTWRYKRQFYAHPYELRLMLRLFEYRQPEDEGF